ncbi:hypothetical protein PHLGIDRAFT_20569 [Phlebiopsis gigantea 11061_1 CR5-6]|uniref:Uncharacterized protein n=1 Tax=Phlebiopsis gigantea (strain 11061_1 CR5-6) TaxID=745531 RepID=A0A0C3RZL7_PHLG1|nr:hypothetical protein PHLGIDRAFT_20569 [Phlebiopsis gigantea 11061_1 CR5-6]
MYLSGMSVAKPPVSNPSLTTSLNALASQFSTASLALAALPTPDRESPAGSTALAVLEQAQSQLKEEIDALREQVEYLRTRTPKEKEREHAGVLPVAETYELRIEAVEKKVDELGEALRLDQQRLYARLLNSTVMTNKVKLTPLVMANGKTPQNFPVTKGEFEHLTKERYELLLKSYGQPDKGDTAAKRQALREFIGLSPANN